MSLDRAPLPVVLFAYNRPRQLERALECLRAAGPDFLYVFCDGSRNDVARQQVEKVRETIRRIDWVDVEIVERPTNLGLSASIRDGLKHVFERNQRAVIIEDDVCVSEGFLDFMRACLDQYADNAEVAGVTGLRYPFDRRCFVDYEYDVFFAPRFSSWGWGTWRRFWESVDFDRASLSEKLRTRKPDLGQGGADLAGMAGALVAGSLRGGWDVYCCLNILLNGQQFVWPTWNQIENYGLVDGTHAGQEMPQWQLAWETPRVPRGKPLKLPRTVRQNTAIAEEFLRFFAESIRPKSVHPLSRTVLAALRSLVRRIKRFVFRPSTGPAQTDPSSYSTIHGAGTYVPCQVEAYFLALNRYVDEGAKVLDVGFGLGYGMNILSIKAKTVSGVDVDRKVYDYCEATFRGRNPRLDFLGVYDGYRLPFGDGEFDVLTCVDVIEHVEDYDRLIREMLRVSRRGVFLSTPNRRPEYTRPDGAPKNPWHLREWSFEEFDRICGRHGTVEWNFLNGPFEGPFTLSSELRHDTLALSPFIHK